MTKILLDKLNTSFMSSLLLGLFFLTGWAFSKDLVPAEKITLVPSADLTDFTTWIEGQGFDKDPDNIFSLNKEGHVMITGNKKGMLLTRSSYRNYRLVAEYKWDSSNPETKKLDSGIFCHTLPRLSPPGRGTMWGLSTVEINLVGRGGGNSGSVLLLGDPRNPPSISVNGKTNKAFVNFKVEKKLEEPIGKWNKINATFDGSKVEVSLNGVQTFVGSDCSPSAGKIFLQSNSGSIIYRKLELYPL